MWCCGRKRGNDQVASKRDSQIRRLQAVGLRRDAPPPQVLQDVEVPVLLNVYSLIESNDKLAKLGMGIYHTGVIVYGIEWGYGEVVDNANASGLFCVHPGQAAGDLFRTIRVGVTTRSPMQVDTILHRLENEWRSCDYHILHHNCNHFAQTLCNLLSTVQKLRVPSWCNRAARVSDRVVPRGLATKVLRMMDDEPPKAKPPAPKTNVNELPVSIIPPRWYKHAKVAQPPRYCYVIPTHEWSNSQMSTPHSSQVSSPTATHDMQNDDSFVPPPGYVVEPLSSMEERHPAPQKSLSSTSKSHKRAPPTVTSTTGAHPPALPLSATEDGHWPPLVPSRGQSTKSASVRQPVSTPLFTPASRGSSQVNSFAGSRGEAHELVFSSGHGDMVPVARRRESIRSVRQGRPPMAPASHHSSGGAGGSPAQPDAELCSSVFDRLSVPESTRRTTSLLMVMPEIDFTPSPGQATPVGVVLHRADAAPEGHSGGPDDASLTSSRSSMGEDVALVMESELDAALAEEERQMSLGSPSVRLDSDIAALSPLTKVEVMKRRHKQEDAQVFAAHKLARAHQHQAAVRDAHPPAAFTSLEAVSETAADEDAAATAGPESGLTPTQKRYAATSTSEDGDDAAVVPLTAHEMRPPRLEPPGAVAAGPELSATPPPPGTTAPEDAVGTAAHQTDNATPPPPPPPPLPPVPTPLSDGAAQPTSPASHEASESSHVLSTNGRGTSEVVWQGEAPHASTRRWSTTSDHDGAVPLRARAASVSDSRQRTPRRPQLAERSHTPQSRRASLPGTPQHGSATTAARTLMGATPPRASPDLATPLAQAPAATTTVARVPPRAEGESDTEPDAVTPVTESKPEAVAPALNDEI